MKPKHALTVTAKKLLAVAALVCAATVVARATDQFSGGSFDGYAAQTVQQAMLLPPSSGTTFTIQ